MNNIMKGVIINDELQRPVADVIFMELLTYNIEANANMSAFQWDSLDFKVDMQIANISAIQMYSLEFESYVLNFGTWFKCAVEKMTLLEVSAVDDSTLSLCLGILVGITSKIHDLVKNAQSVPTYYALVDFNVWSRKRKINNIICI